jgi:hypothetical protein
MTDHTWIFGVLTDLSRYAQKHSLTKFGDIILDAEIVAFIEIPFTNESNSHGIDNKVVSKLKTN